MSLFDQYMKNREETNKKVAEASNQKSGGDQRFWKPTFNKETGTGFAVVRFLPGLDPTLLPYAKVFNHYVKGKNGQIYWEKSLTSLPGAQKDPMSELNTRLWNSGDEKLKDVARSQKRKPQNIVNIQVIEDPENPDNEGKVFLYRANQVVFNKIEEARKSEDEYGEAKDPIEAFDIVAGAPFKIKIKEKAGWQNYDDSEFGKVAPLADTEAEMEEIFMSQHDLGEFLDPETYKSYDELLDHLNNVLADEWWAEDYLQSSVTASAPRTQGTSGDMIDASTFTSDDSSDDTSTSASTDDSGSDDEDLEDFLNNL